MDLLALVLPRNRGAVRLCRRQRVGCQPLPDTNGLDGGFHSRFHLGTRGHDRVNPRKLRDYSWLVACDRWPYCAAAVDFYPQFRRCCFAPTAEPVLPRLINTTGDTHYN